MNAGKQGSSLYFMRHLYALAGNPVIVSEFVPLLLHKHSIHMSIMVLEMFVFHVDSMV